MEISLPLSEMTLEEKLQAMEAIWADISSDGSNFSPPKWHGQILEERQQRYSRRHRCKRLGRLQETHS